MIRIDSRSPRLLALVVALAVFGAACGGNGAGDAAPANDAEEPAGPAVPVGPDTVAAQLRSDLNNLLQEHVVLAAALTGAALGGRTQEFEGATGALDANSAALAATFGSVFGREAGASFEPLWRQYTELVVDYARTRQDAVAQQLRAFAGDFATFVTAMLPDFPADTLADLVTTHVTNLQGVIDAQAARNPNRAFSELRTATAHTGVMAEELSGAIAEAFPVRVSGDPTSAAADLLASLTTSLREHVFLASAATGAALDGRTDEFMAGAGALDANSEAIAAAVGSIYGVEAGRAFGPLWKRHIGFFVDYTTGLAGRDTAKQDDAVEALLAYSEEFGAFLSSASPSLAPDTVATLIKTHVDTLKSVIDAQAAADHTRVYASIRIAGDHMKAIATPWAEAVAQQFPDTFS